MSVDVPKWLEQIDQYRNNPAAVIRTAFNQLDRYQNGDYDIIDPSNPFVFLMEASVVHAVAGMTRSEANTRRQYPSLALNEQELYLHMSDKDYVNRFATPSRTTISLLLNIAEINQRAVPTGQSTIRKMTIPRHTEFEVAGLVFTMQYPIDIRVMAHGGLQVVYDVDDISPLQTLSTNVVNWARVELPDPDQAGRAMEFVRLDIPVNQFRITSQTGKMNLSSGFIKDYKFPDLFCFTRVYYASPTGEWIEMKTTHTEQVFDPTTPTAVLRVDAAKGVVNVSIPEVYLTTQMLNTELRIDIYSTKGPQDLILSGYQANDYRLLYRDLDAKTDARFIEPLKAMSAFSVFSMATVTGGTWGLTFAQLRDRVLRNATGSPDLPVTNVQIGSRLEDLGYNVVTDVDNITNRMFLATRSLPVPVDGSVISGAGTAIQTLIGSMDDLAKHFTVRDNGQRITLLPNTLYQLVNGQVQLVSRIQLEALAAMPTDVRARRINESNYLYSPFHYVLDMNDDRFTHRGYYLDRPSVLNRSFVQENDSLGIAVAAAQYMIERTTTGYHLLVTLRSSDAWKALPDERVFVQLGFKPATEQDRAYQNGELVGISSTSRERMYRFDLGTNFDIDSSDNITLNTFQMYTNNPRNHAISLSAEFDVLFAVSGVSVEGQQSSEIDMVINRSMLPVDAVGVSQERLNVKLGDSLRGLWASSRSVVSSTDYQRHVADVAATWETTVFKRDSTGAIEITRDTDGNLQYTVLHRQGDPKLDAQGNQLYLFRKGDVVVDADRKPIVVNSRKMVRQLDMLFIDGVYWFASELLAFGYRESIPQTIVGWLNNDIGTVSNYLLEQTELFFYPTSTMGYVNVIINEDQRALLPAQQSFSVTFYLSGLSYRDSSLRAALSTMAVKAIDDALKEPVVTINGIYRRITDQASGDVIAVEVRGLGGQQALAAVTLQDDSARLSIKKIASALADGTITVEDDVSISFIQHTA